MRGGRVSDGPGDGEMPQPAAVVDEQPRAPLSCSVDAPPVRLPPAQCAGAALPPSPPATAAAATRADPPNNPRKVVSHHTKRDDDVKKWDIFLSYRVSADEDLVRELYWQLCHRTVVANGKERRLRVFWDRECLKTGEKWEEGFADAICSCHLIVLVMSRTAFVMDGSHNVTTLAEDSRCDNVLLEHHLALELNKLNNTAIMPLFVGDKDDSGQYTHFFQTGCMPKLQEGVVVRQISEKVEGYLEHNAGVAPEMMPKRQSVKDVMDSVTQFQGCFLQGNAYEAVKGAARDIHQCTVRLVNERRERRAVEIFKFSTPQGEEVFEWLADNRLLPFASIFAQNKLTSLRKVSRLTHEEVVKLNAELYALRRGDEDATVQQHGTRVALGDAIERLKSDPRAKTIQEQMEGYRDSKVSVLNLLGAQNQSAAWLGKRLMVWGWFTFMGAVTLWRFRTFLALMRELSYATQHRSVIRYGVQLSNDTHTWRHVSCAHNQASPCVFERSETLDEDVIASNFFSSHENARYVKVLPWLWSGLNDVKILSRAGDMRLGILGGEEGGLDYRILSDGPTGKAWLHYGCSPNRTAGQWSLLDEPIGEVQCCLNSSRVHVCTRDGCLSGDHDMVKYTWYDAKAMCEKRGWRLCRREELTRPASAGCCRPTSLVLQGAVSNYDNCGYDEQLVWTSNVGGVLDDDNHGRIGSDTAVEDSVQVTVDLGRVQVVRGVQVQGGVPEIPGLMCIWSMTYFLFMKSYAWFSVCFFSFFRPSIAGILNTCGLGIILMLASAATLVAVSNDPTVPSLFSQNAVCPGSSVATSTVRDSSTLAILFMPWGLAFALSEVVRPNYLILSAIFGGFILMVFWSALNGYIYYAVTSFTCAVMVFLLFKYMRTHAYKTAAKATAQDMQKYDQAWKSALQPSGGRSQTCINDDLEGVKILLNGKKIEIAKARNATVSLWRPKDATPLSFRSSDFSLLERFIFWIRAGGLGRYGRTGKICQTTTNADMLFEEAAVLSDDFFGLLESNIDIGELCRGPVKRPDRAFQKVARKYYYDPRHLTDLVRGCILLDSLADVRRVLDLVFALSTVFGEEASGAAERMNSVQEDEDSLFGSSGNSNPKAHFTLGSRWKNVGVDRPQGGRELSNAKLATALASKTMFLGDEWEEFGITDLREDDYIKSNASYFRPQAKVFKLCKVKDDFTGEGLGYRYICLNLEVGWTIESESGDGLKFVTVKDFDQKHVRTHICEVQLLLRSTYELKIGGCHDNFVKARNMLAQ